MRKPTRVEKILVLTAVLVLAVWAVTSRFSYKPSGPPRAAAAPNASKADPMSERIREKEEAVRRLSSLRSRHPQIAAEAVKYKAYLAEEGPFDWTATLGDLEALAKKSAVRLSALEPGEIVTRDGWKECFIQVESEKSPMTALLRFIGEIGASPRLFKIVRLKIVLAPGAERSFRCSLTVSKAVLG